MWGWRTTLWQTVSQRRPQPYLPSAPFLQGNHAILPIKGPMFPPFETDQTYGLCDFPGYVIEGRQYSSCLVLSTTLSEPWALWKQHSCSEAAMLWGSPSQPMQRGHGESLRLCGERCPAPCGSSYSHCLTNSEPEWLNQALPEFLIPRNYKQE